MTKMAGFNSGFEDTQFMSAKEKLRVLKAWQTFLKYGCQLQHFTPALYSHLIQHCSFIAHYDRRGFYASYFAEGEDTIHFLSQFDRSKGCPSVEYGGTYWLDGEYADLNRAMVDAAAQFIPALTLAKAKAQQDADLTRAHRLLAKHGHTLKSEDS